jgi:hypothetical protein
MELPPTVELLLDIERRQDEVLRNLDALDAQVELALAQYQRELKVFSPVPGSG